MNEDDDSVGTETHRSKGVVVLDDTYPGYLGMKAHTNNTGELSAFGECLYWLNEQSASDVTIFADSAYVINTIQGTFNGDANKTAYIIIRNLYQYVAQKHNINIQHVRSHTGNVWNSVADMLAKEGAKLSLNLLPTAVANQRQMVLHLAMTPSTLSGVHNEPLKLLNLPIRSKFMFDSELLRQYSDTECPLALSEIYEWIISKEKVDDKCKMTKKNFCNMTLLDQVKECHAWGANIESTSEMLYKLQQSPHDLHHLQCPHTKDNIMHMTIHQLIQVKYWIKEKIDVLKKKFQCFHKASKKYVDDCNQEASVAQQRMEYKNSLMIHTQIATDTNKRLTGLVASNQQFRSSRISPENGTNSYATSTYLEVDQEIHLLFPRKQPVPSTPVVIPHPSKEIELTFQGTKPVHQIGNLQEFYNSLEITENRIGDPQMARTIKVATININQLTEEKLHHLCYIFHQQSIDVLGIVDTRVTSAQAKWMSRCVRQSLSASTSCYHSLAQRKKKGKGPCCPGGIMVIVSHHIGGHPVTIKQDPMKMGLILQVIIPMHETSIQVITTYWPSIHQPNKLSALSGSVHQRCINYANENFLENTPAVELLQQTIDNMIQEVSQLSTTVIIMGDFNQKWKNQVMLKWSSVNHFLNTPIDTSFFKHSKLSTYESPQGNTIIDHITHRTHDITFLQPITVSMIHGAEWRAISDHNMLIVTYDSQLRNVQLAQHNSAIVIPPIIELNLDRQNVVRTFRTRVTEWTLINSHMIDLPGGAESFLDNLAAQSVNITDKLTNKKPKKFSIYDAPREYTVYQGILRTLHSMRKHWNGVSSQLPILHVWEGFAKKYSSISGLTEGDVEALLLTVDCSITQWTAEVASKSTSQLLYKCQKTISLTITILNRLRRRAARAKYKDFHDKRERLRQQGRLRSVISSVLGDSKPKSRPTDFNLHTVRNDKGQLETDPEMIHNLLTSNFEEWYRSPNAYDEVSSVDLKTTALSLMNDRKFFDNYMHKKGLTIGQLDEVFQAIQIKVSSQVVDAMASSLDVRPTWEEFVNQIKRVPKNSTPGPSGLTYNMMKAWSTDTKRRAYDALVQVWENRTIPEAWKWRWLVVIPKTKELHPAMNLLRPLTMVETYRKIWLGIINNKIQRLLEQYQVLHPSQNGSRFAHGTCTASLSHVYHMETILEQYGSLHRSSWDIKRAFDSVDKVFLRIAWVRLGLPPDLVEWIVNMDEGGTTIIKSPIAEASWKLMRYRSVIPTKGTIITPSMLATSNIPQSYVEPVLSFTAERGTGQGDVMSPSTWAAFIDILLSMQTDDNSVHIPGEDGCLRRVLDIAYVDDIESSKANEREIQRKGDIVTTFCRATDLQLSVDKLRRSFQDLTGTEKWETVQPTQLQVALNNHKEVSVKVEGFTEYLGVKYDIDINHYSITQHDDTLLILRQESKAVLMSGASLHSKLVTLYSSVFPTLKYKARMNCGQLADFEEYDREIYPLLLHLTRQRNGFPKALLKLSSTYGGIDLMSPTDQIHFEKLMVLYRSLVAPSTTPHNQAARDLLFYAYTRQKVTPVPYQQLDLAGSQGEYGHFLDSLLDWMELRNMTFHRKGVVVRGTPITEDSSNIPLEVLHSWNISYEEDIVTPYPNKEILQHFGITPSIIPTTTYQMRQQQFWQIQDESGEWYAEIVGWDISSLTVYTKRWTARGTNKIVIELPVTISAYPYAQLFPSVTASQLLVKRYSFQFHARECFSHLLQSSAPRMPQLKQKMEGGTYEKLMKWHKNGEVVNISVLSSCFSEQPQLCQAFKPKQEQVRSGCHILIVTRHKSGIKESYINITNCHQLDCVTTTELELYGTVVAMAICHWLSTQYPVAPNLRITYDQLHKMRISVSVNAKGIWLKQCAQYFQHEGVHLTPPNSGHDSLRYREQLSTYVSTSILPVHINQMSVEANTLAEEIVPHQMWTIRYNNCLTISPLKHLHSKDLYEEYLHTRDTKYASAGKWSESTPALFSKVFQLEKRNVLQRAKMTKIIFDWGYHGGNRHKKKNLKSDEQACDFCQLTDSNFHWMSDCTHPASVVLRTQAIHDLEEHVGKLVRQLKDVPLGEKETSCSLQLQMNLNIEITVYKYILKSYDKQEIGSRIWTSNWTNAMQEGLIGDIYALSSDERKIITHSNVNCLRRSLLSVGRILGKCLEEIWNYKAGLIREHYNDAKEQVPIITVSRSKRSTRKDVNYDESTDSVNLPPLPERERNFHPTDIAATEHIYESQSPIIGAGKGAFATKLIRKNTAIGEYFGIQTKTASLTSEYVFYNPVSKMYIDALLSDGTLTCAAARINDKLIPGSANCGFFIEGKGKNSKVVIRTLRDVAENEEYTIEYGHVYWRDGGYSKELTSQACKAYKKTKDPVWKQLLQKLEKESSVVRDPTPVEQLDRQLESQFDIIDIASDGNCMFNAIAHQMRHKQPKWNTVTGSRLRQTVCTWLRHHQYYTLATLDGNVIHASAETFPICKGLAVTWTEFCERTSQLREWGEAPHIFGLSVIYNLDIHIHTLTGVELIRAERSTEMVNEIHVALYNPYPHYASLIPKLINPSIKEEDLTCRWVAPSKDGSIKFAYITEAITYVQQQPTPNPMFYYQDWAKANIPLIPKTVEGAQFLIDKLQAHLIPSATQEDKVQHKETFTISEVMLLLPDSVGLLNGITTRKEAFYLESDPGVSYDMYLIYTLASVEVCFGVRTPIEMTDSAEDESIEVVAPVKKAKKVQNPKPRPSGVYAQMRKYPGIDVKAKLRQQLEQIQRDSNIRWDITNGTVIRQQLNQLDSQHLAILPNRVSPPKVKAKPRRKGNKVTAAYAITNYLPLRTSIPTATGIDSVTETRGRPPPKPPPMVETTAIDRTHQIITTHSMVGKYKLHFNTSYIQQTPTMSLGDNLQRTTDSAVTLATNLLSSQLNRYTNRLELVVQSSHQCLQTLEKDSGQPNQLIKEYKGHRITLETYQRLRPGKWLNDEIINYYFQLLQDKDVSAWYLSTFFMTTLVNVDGYNYAKVRKWSKGRTRRNRHINILDLVHMYIPINISNKHWTLIVVDIQKKNILYLDSLLPSGHGEEYCRKVLQYIQDEVADKQQILLDTTQWTTTIGTTQPQQENSVDCGIYVLMYADCIHHKFPLQLIKAEHISTLRKWVAISIYEDKVTSEESN